MRRVAIFIAILFGIIPFSASAESPTVRALVVGIATYKYADGVNLRNLRGPANDIVAMNKVLIDRFGVKPENIITLKDAQAERAKLLAVLEEVLVDRSQKGDIAIFYFAGHGSQAFDASSDEPSRYDDTILPYDARSPGGATGDILDDEIGAVVRRAQAKGVNAVVILDSCHSGTGIRFLGETRMAPPIKISAPGQGVHQPAAVIGGSNDAVLLAAAKDTEEALESERGGKMQGEFTRALVAVLSQAEPGVTYADVLTRVRVGMDSAGIAQHPQGEGPLQQKFLGVGPLSRLPLTGNPISKTEIRLSAGAAGGVTSGSDYSFFKSVADAGNRVGVLASGKVSEVGPDYSTVILASARTLPEIVFALETAHNFGSLELKVAVVGGEQEEPAAVTAAVKHLPFVKIVDNAGASYWLKISNGSVQLVKNDETPISASVKLDGNLAESLELPLTSLARYQAALSLQNPVAPQSPVKAQILLSSGDVNDLRQPRQAGGEALLKSGETFQVSLFNPTPAKLYVYLLNLTPDLCVRRLMPPPNGTDEPLLGFVASPLLRAGKAKGREYFLVLSSTAPVAIEGLSQPCFVAPRDARAKLFSDPLANLIGLAGSARASSVSQVPLDGWATSIVSMIVE